MNSTAREQVSISERRPRRIRAIVVPLLALAAIVDAGTPVSYAADQQPGEVARTPRGPSSRSNQDLDVQAAARARNGVWILVGRRNLDPEVFGTVADPRGTWSVGGVPVERRASDGQGHWTTTAGPVQVSNVTLPLAPESFARVRVRDRTPSDFTSYASETSDEVEVEVLAVRNDGLRIEIEAHAALPKGPHHEFFGGVGTNVVQHGHTGLGSMLVPQVFSYISVYAKAAVRVNGEVPPGNDNQLVHLMVSQGVRDTGNNPGAAGGNGPFIGMNSEVDPDDLELLVILPGTRFDPAPSEQPISGVGQKYIHLVFEDVELRGSTLNGTISR